MRRLIEPNTTPNVPGNLPATADAVVRHLSTTSDVIDDSGRSVEQVLEMCRTAEYVCDRDTLLQLESIGAIPKIRGRLWTRSEVYLLLGVLESRRRWKPTPSKHHDMKKSAALLRYECDVADGQNPFDDLRKYDLEFLLLAVTQEQNPAVREMFYLAVRAKLETIGVSL